MSKYILSALLLIGVGALHMTGVMGSETTPALTSGETTDGSALLNNSPITEEEDLIQLVTVVVTGYSSRVEETDDTPFITAAGTKVRPGVVAANWLPLGTKVRIPDLFGDSVFTVEDRMNRRNADKLDIWFSTTEEALRFGVQKARIEIL